MNGAPRVLASFYVWATRHKALWEDIQDVLVSRSRRHERGVSIDKVKAGLIASGKLRG